MKVKNYTGNVLILVSSLLLDGCSELKRNRQDVEQRIPSSLERRISQESTSANEKPDKYAVLLNGANEDRFVAEITAINQIILESGFKKENIYILDEDGKEKSRYAVDGIASKKNVEAIFTHLSKKIDREDILVVHVSDHGIRRKIKLENSNSEEYEEVTEIVLPSGNVSEIDFERYLSGINPKFGLITTEICYGGGLAKRVGKGSYIGIAQTTEKDVSYTLIGNSFGVFLYQAFKYTAESDQNKDGRVTVDEAFEYAKKKHYWARNGQVSPQLISELDVKNISIE